MIWQTSRRKQVLPSIVAPAQGSWPWHTANGKHGYQQLSWPPHCLSCGHLWPNEKTDYALYDPSHGKQYRRWCPRRNTTSSRWPDRGFANDAFTEPSQTKESDLPCGESALGQPLGLEGYCAATATCPGHMCWCCSQQEANQVYSAPTVGVTPARCRTSSAYPACCDQQGKELNAFHAIGEGCTLTPDRGSRGLRQRGRSASTVASQSEVGLLAGHHQCA